MHPYMYMGRFVPKEGQNREKVTFYFVDTQELQPQPFKKRYYWYISRVRVVRAPSNSDVDFLLSQVSHLERKRRILWREKQGKSEKKIRKSPKMQA